MKRILTPVLRLAFCLCAAACVLPPPSAQAFGAADTLTVAEVVESNACEVRSMLLMEAMDAVGVAEPKKAAEVWGQGLMARSAALQYAVMGRALRAQYARQLEETAPNWVTGMSSPWIDSFRILQIRKTGLRTREVVMCFATATSTGPADEYKAVLTLSPEDGFYRITGVEMDEGLYPYTGFRFSQ